MSHQQLVNSKYRNWVKAGLGLKYVKDGLEPFCDDIVRQQHENILNKVKQKHNLATVNCGLCNIRTLQPDHIRSRSKQCPLGQTNCNCQYPGGKINCPNNVCGAIYDEIINLHTSTPPAPSWKNTDAKFWCTEPWAVAKCFINAPGYTQKMTAAEIDCSGLLHVLINNKDLHKHLHCAITGNDVFCKVRRHRNSIFHCETMEIEDADVSKYIDDMIAVLQDDQELKGRKESKAAVQKLLQLKNEDFIITTSNEAEVKAAMTALKELESKIQDDLELKRNEVKHLLEQEGSLAVKRMEEKDLEIKKEMEKRSSTLMNDIELKSMDLKKEIEESFSKSKTSTRRHDYTEQKTKFQTMLIDIYKEQVIKVSPLPLLPEEDETDISDVYVPPLMKTEIKRNGQKEEATISVDEIFKKEGRAVRRIYVLGEAGSGKSAFCKSLVSHWCLAHSQTEFKKNENDLIKAMKEFQFLFYISLRHFMDCCSIQMMLEKAYGNSSLFEVLEHESCSCVILLDGLDEWSPLQQGSSQFQTKGLPERDLSKHYTIITTTRPWKFYNLRVKNSEVDQVVKLKGIDENSGRVFTKKTLQILNDNFQKSKVADDFEFDLRKSPLFEISHVPMILQQLICMWFDENLNDTTKCAVYSHMLELFFEWASLKVVANQEHPDVNNASTLTNANVALPGYLSHYTACCSNEYIVQNLSRLAYESLFDKHKENTLAFTNSKLIQLKIPNDIKSFSLKIGLLSEDRGVTLLASRRQNSSYSFIHKSVQEYLAALHIVIEFEKLMQTSEMNEIGNDSFMEHVIKYFGSCKTLNDILDKSSVFIMVCGLEPQLTQYVAEYVYSIAEADEKVKEYRSTLCLDQYWEVDDKMLCDIQKCIANCIFEMISGVDYINPRIHMGDIIINDSKHSEDILVLLNKEIIMLDRIKSLYIKSVGKWYNESAMKVLSSCSMLKTMRYAIFSAKDRHVAKACDVGVVELLRKNRPTLECVDFQRVDEQILKSLIQTMPDMNKLVSVQITHVQLSHETCSSFSTQVSQCTHLKQISIDIDCNMNDTHSVDLLHHTRLEYVKFGFGSFNQTEFNTDNVVTCKLPAETAVVMKQISDTLHNACKLQNLGLYAGSRLMHDQTDAKTMTEYLVRLLPSLTSLSTLCIWYFTLTGNIVTLPSDMKKLSLIRLGGVSVSIATWCKFIDSVSALAQCVLVDTYNLKITNDEGGHHSRPEELETEARQYVREKTESFDVTRDGSGYFEFVKKIESM